MAAIDGLGSGLDTTSIIRQLMDLEKIPQNRLNQQKTAATARSTTWSQLDLAVGSVKTAAVKFATPALVSGAVTATSANQEALSVSAAPGAMPGRYKVEVTALATARQWRADASSTTGVGSLVLTKGLDGSGITVADAADLTQAATPTSQNSSVKIVGGLVTVTNGTAVSTGTLSANSTVTVGGLEFTAGATVPDREAGVTVGRVKTASGTLTDLAKAVNAAGGIAGATVVNTGASTATMVLTAKATGVGDTLEVSSSFSGGAPPAFSAVVGTGTDAVVEVDDVLIPDVHTNTLTDVIPGLTLALQKPGTTEVTVAQDTAGPSGQVKAVVDAMNALLTQVTNATKYDVANKRAAPLTGNAAVRQITNDLYKAVGDVVPQGSGASLSALGISVKADGTYSLDEAKLAASLKEKPTATAELLGALSTKLTEFADNLRNGKTVGGRQIPGVLTAGRDSAQTEAERLQKRIDEWDRRLVLTQARLTKQYTALDSALGGLRGQGTWLSGAIGSLGKWGE